MLQNLKAGSVVAGGSTLTQQTAKNLYYRPDRSLASKFRELLNALRLEAAYDKEQILEFYANQFHCVIRDKLMKQPDRITSTTSAGDDIIRKASFSVQYLLSSFSTND